MAIAHAIAELDVTRILDNARDLLEELEKAERARAAAQEKRETEQFEQRIVAEAGQMSVGEILAAIEQNGVQLSLEGEQISLSAEA